jgi:hypothetical protein
MSEEQNPCRINPAEGDDNLAIAQGAGLISNIIPSVSYESVSIETIAVDENIQTGEIRETIDLILDLSFVEGVIGEEAASWYDDSNYTQYLRLRVIGCFGQPFSRALDFTSQRFNEYSAGLMNTRGAAGSAEFIDLFKNASYGAQFEDGRRSNQTLGQHVTSLLDPMGPLDTQNFTRTLKSSNNNTYFFPLRSEVESPNEVHDVVVYDSPITNLIVIDLEGSEETNPNYGRPVRQMTNQVMPQRSQPDSNLSERTYMMEKSYLAPVVIRIGPDAPVPNGQESTPAQDYVLSEQLSTYAYIYFDYDLFLENLDLPPESIEMDPSGLTAGLGFLNPGIFAGTQAVYPLQQEGLPPESSAGFSEVPAKNGNILQDLRRATDLQAPPVNTALYETTRTLLENLGLNKSSLKEVKDTHYFSPLWLSKDNSDSARYCFAFDKRCFLEKNSVFPMLYRNNATAIELLDGGYVLSEEDTANVLSIKMLKRRVNFEGTIGLPGHLTLGKHTLASDNLNTPEEFIADPGLVNSPDIFLDENSTGIELYQGYDSYADHFKAGDVIRFQYGVEVVMHDPSYKFLKTSSTLLEESQNKVFELYESIINSPGRDSGEASVAGLVSDGMGLYDSRTNKITTPLSDIIFSGARSYEDILLEEIEKYTSFLILFSPEGAVDQNSMVDGLTSLVHSKNPAGILELAKIIGFLCSSVNQLTDRVLPGDTFNMGSVDPSQVFMKNGKLLLIEDRTYFRETFDYGVQHGTGYEYIFGAGDQDIYPTAGLPILRREALDTRVREEFNKYFDFYIEDNESQANPRGTSYANSSYSFLTPKVIRSYGKAPVVQTDYKNSQSNVNEYDINRYAELFSDLIKIKKETNFLTNPYGYVQDRQGQDRQNIKIENTLAESLEGYSCALYTSKGIEYPSYSPELLASDYQSKSSEKKSAKKSTKNLFSTVMGNGNPKFIEDTEKLARSQEYDTKANPADDREEVVEDGPVKLMFGILGELELDPHIETSNYHSNDFNSLSNVASRMSLTEQNSKDIIEGLISNIPNQLKSMLIVATAENQGQYGTGFDAVRTSLVQADSPNENKTISAVLTGDSFPPYKFIGDPMKEYCKFLAFWMNYKQIGVVEYLSGFQSTDLLTPEYNFRNTRMPSWKRFTQDLYDKNYRRRLLCRIRSYGAQDVVDLLSVTGVEKEDLFELPVYNRYFILDAGSVQEIEQTPEIPSQARVLDPKEDRIPERLVFRNPELTSQRRKEAQSSKLGTVIVSPRGNGLEDVNINTRISKRSIY